MFFLRRAGREEELLLESESESLSDELCGHFLVEGGRGGMVVMNKRATVHEGRHTTHTFHTHCPDQAHRPTKKRTESESDPESDEEELLELDDEDEDDDDDEEEEEEVLSSSDSEAAASPPKSFSSPMYAPGSARNCASSASCALAALFTLFFIRLNDRSFPGDIFLAVPSFACRVVLQVGGCVGCGIASRVSETDNHTQTPNTPDNHPGTHPHPHPCTFSLISLSLSSNVASSFT